MVLLGSQAANRHHGHDGINGADADGNGSSVNTHLGGLLAAQPVPGPELCAASRIAIQPQYRPGTLAKTHHRIELPGVSMLEIGSQVHAPRHGAEMDSRRLHSPDANRGGSVMTGDSSVDGASQLERVIGEKIIKGEAVAGDASERLELEFQSGPCLVQVGAHLLEIVLAHVGKIRPGNDLRRRQASVSQGLPLAGAQGGQQNSREEAFESRPRSGQVGPSCQADVMIALSS